MTHNTRAVHQKHLGCFHGNPANLEPLPPIEAAIKHVDATGGADAVLCQGARRLRRRRLAVVEAGKRCSADDSPNSDWNLREFLHAPRTEMNGIRRLHFSSDTLNLSGTGVVNDSSSEMQ